MAKAVTIAALCKLIQDIKRRLSGKVDAVSGKGLSTNDFTTEYRDKLRDLGTVVYSGASTGTSSILNATLEEVRRAYLSPGTWLVVGRADFQPGGTAGTYRRVTLQNDAGSSVGTTQTASPTTGNTTIEVSAIVTSTSMNDRVSLLVMQGSGSSILMNNPTTRIFAVKLT